MAKILIILLIALVLESIGVVYLSKGIKQVGDLKEVSVSAIAALVKEGITNRYIILGIFFEALFFIGLLMLMSKGDVSFVWPLTSVSLVMTTIAAKFFLHEKISGTRWSGVLLIMAGAMLITWSEKAKDRADQTMKASTPAQEKLGN
jgi:transporter family protein